MPHGPRHVLYIEMVLAYISTLSFSASTLSYNPLCHFWLSCSWILASLAFHRRRPCAFLQAGWQAVQIRGPGRVVEINILAAWVFFCITGGRGERAPVSSFLPLNAGLGTGRPLRRCQPKIGSFGGACWDYRFRNAGGLFCGG